MAEGVVIAEVAESDLDPDTLWAQTAGIAHQAAHGHPGSGEATEQGPPHGPGGASQQQHWREATVRARSLEFADRRCRTGPPEPKDNSEDPTHMTYVIAEPCIGTKDNSCVEVCPVDCIHPTPDEPDYDNVEMLYIDPEECIDCDACVEACPVDACFAEDQLPEEWQKYIQINSQYYVTK
jgi:NAD-dependent dihydropyrimidine dehydrogenase PreA subunit